MPPVAPVCAGRGFTVSGSDVRASEALKALARLDVRVHTRHAAGNVPTDATAVVFTHAIGPDDPEIPAARALNVPVVHRSAVLNALMAEKNRSIAVMGTHGRSSTAGTLAFVLARAGQESVRTSTCWAAAVTPGAVTTSSRRWMSRTVRTSGGHECGVVTNIAHDHPENYAGEKDVVDAFEDCLALGLRGGGTLVLGVDSSGGRELAARMVTAEDGPRVVTLGVSPSADWRLTNVSTGSGRSSAVLVGSGGVEYDLALRTENVHQLLNAAAAITTLHTPGPGLRRRGRNCGTSTAGCGA
ncbi:Mur ligase domain-containing protein [Streptomyces sp. NPDC047841]|uniref:Mur ligase domain-containing protein n=1 Tax=Streptomyces sp. NPDC047841 TaxID=3154708 RepID=UPI003454C96D